MINVNEFYTKKLQILNSVFVPSAPIEVKDIFPEEISKFNLVWMLYFKKDGNVVCCI